MAKVAALARFQVLQQRLSLARLRRRLSCAGIESVTIARANGVRLEVPSTSDLLGPLMSGRFERDHLQALMGLVGPGETVIDVGANIGAISCELALLVGPNGSVFSFEPDPSNYRLLCANLARNDFEMVRPQRLAVSNRLTTGVLELPLGRGEYASLAPVVHASVRGAERRRETVAVSTLDEALGSTIQSCKLIKIDTEGHEWHVLQGADQLLRRQRPLLSLEIVPELLASHGASTTELLDALAALSYSLRDLAGNLLKVDRLGEPGYHQFIGEP